MAVVTKSIGATGRDYSTVAAWEAKFDNTSSDYASGGGDEPVGEMYDDADPSFTNDGVTFNDQGPGTGFNSITLKCAAGQEHDGVFGAGITHLKSATGSQTMINVTNAISSGPITFQDFEIDFNGASSDSSGAVNGVLFDAGNTATANRVIVHDMMRSGTVFGLRSFFESGTSRYFLNCIVANLTEKSSGSFDAMGIVIDSNVNDTYVYNCSVYKVGCTDATNSRTMQGCECRNDADHHIKNNIVMDTYHDGAGSAVDYETSTSTSMDASNNMSSDTTAPGANSHTSETSTSIWDDPANNDFTLTASTNAVDGGVALGTTENVNLAINGRDRDAEGDTWDMGAWELVSVAGGGLPAGSLSLLGVGV